MPRTQSIRWTDTDYEEVKAAAVGAGVSMNAFVTKAALMAARSSDAGAFLRASRHYVGTQALANASSSYPAGGTFTITSNTTPVLPPLPSPETGVAEAIAAMAGKKKPAPRKRSH